ncbi:hypothetical protein LCGC14_0861080 [marine sediment metagenome]|uniref:Uncharacterized protein n=1 Tax=marine sediment metagenome TaxID=412755 RepID=A0A0F9SED6_9ZZZZ
MTKKLKIIERDVVIKRYYVYCPIPKCNKEMSGGAVSQVEYNLKLHLDKHKFEKKKKVKKK